MAPAGKLDKGCYHKKIFITLIFYAKKRVRLYIILSQKAKFSFQPESSIIIGCHQPWLFLYLFYPVFGPECSRPEAGFFVRVTNYV